MISILKCNICLMFCRLKHFELPCCSYLIAAPWSKDLFILEGLCGCCSFHLYPWGSGLFCVLRKATFLFPFSPLDVRMVLGWNKTALTCEHTPKWHKGNSKVWKRPFVLLCFTFQPNQPWHQQTHHRCFHDNSLIAVRVHVHTNVIPVPLESVFIASEKRPGTQPPHTLTVLGRENKASQGKKSFLFFFPFTPQFWAAVPRVTQTGNGNDCFLPGPALKAAHEGRSHGGAMFLCFHRGLCNVWFTASSRPAPFHLWFNVSWSDGYRRPYMSALVLQDTRRMEMKRHASFITQN